MSKLFIFLPLTLPRATQVYEYAFTPDGGTLMDQASAPVTLLPAVQRGCEVVAIVPATALSWHSVELPQGVGAGSRRLRPILEGLLEDRLLDESAELHFAVAPDVVAGGSLWVSACDKAWLSGHLQALEAVHCTVTRIVPEFTPNEGTLQLHAVGPAQMPQLVATGADVGGVLRVPLTASALGLLPAPGTYENNEVFAESDLVALAGQLFQCNVSLLTRQQRWLDAYRTTWDLAQFELSSSGRVRIIKRLSDGGRKFLQAPGWRAARWGALLLLVFNLAGLNAWALKEQSAQRAQRAALQGLLTQTFPQVKVVVDAPLQMEREVATLRQGVGAASGGDLEAMLMALGGAMPTSQAASDIEFVVGEVRIKGLQLSAAQASTVSAQLRSSGYSARQEGDVLVIKQETRIALVL